MPKSVWQAWGLEFRDGRLEREYERGLMLGGFQTWPVALLLQAAVAAAMFWKDEGRSLWTRAALSCGAEALYVLWRAVPKLRASMSSRAPGDWVDTDNWRPGVVLVSTGLLLFAARALVGLERFYGHHSPLIRILLLLWIFVSSAGTPLLLTVQMPLLGIRAAVFFPYDDSVKYCQAVFEVGGSWNGVPQWDSMNSFFWLLLQGKHVVRQGEPRLEGTLARCQHWLMFVYLMVLTVSLVCAMQFELCSREEFLNKRMQSEELHEELWSDLQVSTVYLLLLTFFPAVAWQVLLKVYGAGQGIEC